MNATRTNVFVYGSLLSGLHNHDWLHGEPCVRATTTRDAFTMIDVGSFPAVIDSNSDDAPAWPVVGELYAVTPEGLAALDRLEGYRPDGRGLYDRIDVTLDDGTVALMYVMRERPRWGAGDIVTESDWRSWYMQRSATKAVSSW